MLELTSAKGLALISDTGRKGLMHQGVSWCSAMDTHALKLANLYCGNDLDAAGLECMGRFEWQCIKPCGMLLASPYGQVLVNGHFIVPGQTIHLSGGDAVEILPARQGVWTTLAFQGGIHVERVLGSHTTCLHGQFGGLEGRALRQGDTLPMMSLSKDLDSPGQRGKRRLALHVLEVKRNEPVSLRFVKGPEFDGLGKLAAEKFLEQSWSLGLNSSRMGFRFEGRALKAKKMPEMYSHAVHRGVIQLPPIGKPMVLMADAQATGGYPRLGAVIQADIWKLSQLSPGQSVQFEEIGMEQAIQALLHQQGELSRLAQALDLRLPGV